MCKTVFEYLLPPFSKRLLIHTEKYRVHGFLAALMWFTVRFPNYVQSGKLLMIFMWIIIIWSILDRILFRKNSWTFHSIFDWLVLYSLIPCVSALLDLCWILYTCCPSSTSQCPHHSSPCPAVFCPTLRSYVFLYLVVCVQITSLHFVLL